MILSDGKDVIIKIHGKSYRFISCFMTSFDIGQNLNSTELDYYGTKHAIPGNSNMDINITLTASHCEIDDEIKISEKIMVDNIARAVRKFGIEEPRNLDI